MFLNVNLGYLFYVRTKHMPMKKPGLKNVIYCNTVWYIDDKLNCEFRV